MRQPDFPRGPRVTLDFEGQPVPAHEGETVAVALLAADRLVLSRSIKFHRPRSAFCLSGDCGACLMRIDGQPNVRACRMPVRGALRCERQNAWPSASLDVLAAADLFFPEGMDHHTLMTSPRPLNQIMQRVVQQLGGLGRLPDPDKSVALSALPAVRSRHVGAVVVGAGPSGLAAATVLARELSRGARGAREVVVLDAAPQPGGSYLCHPGFGPDAAARAVAGATAAGAEVLAGAAAAGFYPEDVSPAAPGGRRGLLAVAAADGLIKLTAERYVYATGGAPQNLLFEGNDRPGVFAGRAIGLLLASHGVLVGRRALVVGADALAGALAAALTRAGCPAELIDGSEERVVRALGSERVDGAVVASRRGGEQLERHVACDVIAVCPPPAPAFQLPAMHGAATVWHERLGFAIEVDADGRTRAPGVFACGEVTAQRSIAAAREHGEQVGRAAARELC